MPANKKRLLLTGVGGSIGCHTLIHILHNTDWIVVGIDSFRHKGLASRVAKMLDYHPEYVSRVRTLRHDLTEPIDDHLEGEIGAIDFVIAMASLSDVHDSIVNPVPFIRNNVEVVLNTLEYARRVRPSAFLLVSTDEVYGPTDGKHLHREWDSIVPSNPYSASKVAQEAIAISYWRSYNIPLIIVNLMNNFGEMQSPAKFPAMVQRAVSTGETVQIHTSAEGKAGSRFYLHSRNCSDALLFLLKNVTPHLHGAGQNTVDGKADKPNRYNIVGERQIDNLALARLIAEELGKPLKVELVPATTSRPGHDLHYGLDGTRLAALGWKPPVSFEESLRNTVKWYQENPEWLEKHGR